LGIVTTQVQLCQSFISFVAPVAKCTCQCYSEGRAFIQFISVSWAFYTASD